MGKEFKIGLAVVGVLLVAFAALLARQLLATVPNADPVAPQGFAASAPYAPIDTPRATIVPTEQVPSRWHQEESGEADSSRYAADVPRENYLPPEEGAADRYGQVTPMEREAPTASLGNPFRSRAPAAELEPTEDPPVEQARRIDDHERQQSRNPLRRLSAEEPIESMTIPDRYARQEIEFPEATAARALEPEESELEMPPRRPVPPRDSFTQTQRSEAVATQAREPFEPRYRPQAQLEQPLTTVPQANPPADGKYVVQPNDSLWTISEKVYGVGNYFKALAEFNRFNLPRSNQLQVGTTIAVPPVSVLEQKFPSLVPKQRKSALVQPKSIPASTRGRLRGDNVYIVEEGDTLFDIARYELGKASRWAEIYDLNRDMLGEDFDYLRPGTQLTMPQKAGGDVMTRQPDSGWQR